MLQIYKFGETAAEARTRLGELGLSGPALDAALRAGGLFRHDGRVHDAARAARAAADAINAVSQVEWSFYEHTAYAAALTAVEVVGVGGGLTGRGHATRRLPEFASLGKGRRQATDGAAWDAAIKEALSKLVADAQATELRFTPLNACRVLVGLYRGAEELGEVMQELTSERMQALCLTALGVRRVRSLPYCNFAGDPLGWGEAYNDAVAAAAAAVAEAEAAVRAAEAAEAAARDVVMA